MLTLKDGVSKDHLTPEVGYGGSGGGDASRAAILRLRLHDLV